ncbi:MAG TPA: SRPBCC family protein [Candidatus Eisenbacteria bacterium]
MRPSATLLFVSAFAAIASALAGEVVDVGQNGFTIRQSVVVASPPERAYAAVLENLGKWWDADHTWSHDSANLSIEARAGGCWCERLPGGGAVRHMTLVFFSPGKLLRFEGGLGPLQAMGIAGVMTWTFHPQEKGASVELRYVVGGYNPAGFKDLAPVVDAVLRGQLERYRQFVDTGKP